MLFSLQTGSDGRNWLPLKLYPGTLTRSQVLLLCRALILAWPQHMGLLRLHLSKGLLVPGMIEPKASQPRELTLAVGERERGTGTPGSSMKVRFQPATGKQQWRQKVGLRECRSKQADTLCLPRRGSADGTGSVEVSLMMCLNTTV